MSEQKMETAQFLVEIGTEELPPKALKRLSQAFADGIEAGLQEAELPYGEVDVFATPRRLAVRIHDLQTRQADKTVEKKGPAKKAAFDAEGQPTKALQGFARSCGASVDQLQELETPKGIWMVFYQQVEGQSAAELLPEIVAQSLAKLPIPKRMRWGSSEVEFVRPVHWVVMMLDEQVVPATILGHTAGNQTRGHRFHAPEPLTLEHPNAYEVLLKEKGFVMADFGERAHHIFQTVTEAAKAHGGQAVIDEALLEEVTALNEWPVPIVGSFDTEFLAVPPEALISAMKGHQKYFHMVDAAGKLMPNFITLANIDSKNPEAVKDGNERVIRPRLSDAKFFWDQDRKQPLESFLPRLKTVVFQQKLGTLLDKTDRLETLSAWMAKALKQDGETVALCERAAHLSKCDLMTEMVGEFPDLQGVMGRYYALEQQEAETVAMAIDEQYQPRFAGDQVPQTVEGQVLAIADKLDTITGIYGIGQGPTGDKDPFGLRRAALGMMRVMIENELDLELPQLIQQSLSLHAEVESSEALVNEIYNFIISRLRAYYATLGITAEQFEAVRVCHPASPVDFHARIVAVREFATMPEAEALSAANKRIQNILKKIKTPLPETVNAELLSEAAEQALYEQWVNIRQQVAELVKQEDYTAAIRLMATMRAAVDQFFDEVMVMAEDELIRQNRLALLNAIHQMFTQVADISRL